MRYGRGSRPPPYEVWEGEQAHHDGYRTLSGVSPLFQSILPGTMQLTVSVRVAITLGWDCKCKNFHHVKLNGKVLEWSNVPALHT